MNSNLIVLELVSVQNTFLVGGKAASLGEMIQAGIDVPPGFVVTTRAKAKMSLDLQKEILEAFDELGSEFVAVRSSAVAEDGKAASWAGQLETYLNVTRRDLIQSIEKCWASISSERAQAYADEQGITASPSDVGVVVQAMIQSDVAGVVFSANPVTNDTDEIMIEAVLGLGESLVSGQVTPDNYLISKDGEIKGISISEQTRQLVKSSGGVDWVDLGTAGSEQKLTTEQIDRLVEQVKRVESHYGFPVDIEWVIKDRELFIMQSRPITTLVDESKSFELEGSYIPTITRPATVQRDEIVRSTANAVEPVDVVSVPHEGRNRTYYLEQEGAKRLLGKCVSRVATADAFETHLKSYESVASMSRRIRDTISRDPKNYVQILRMYDDFLDALAWFLFVGVAVDRILYPKLEKRIVESFGDDAWSILESISSQRQLTDYQKFRIAICELVIAKSDGENIASRTQQLTEKFKHINEYSFVEILNNEEDIEGMIAELTLESARSELEQIHAAILSDEDWDKTCDSLADKDLIHEASVVNTYMWLRTDRIDRLTYAQVGMRDVFRSIASDIASRDKQDWTVDHVANLARLELDDFVKQGIIPDFKSVCECLDQQYLYTYIDGQVTLHFDATVVEAVKSQLSSKSSDDSSTVIHDGFSAYKGKTLGKVVKVRDVSDLQRVKEGDILVAVVTMPDYTTAMKRAAGVITEEGGVTSHAAIVARELKKPCIVGAAGCMKTLDDGADIELDAINTIIRML